MSPAVLAERPEGHELAVLRGRGRVDGNLVDTAVFRPPASRTVEAEGRDYSSARATLEGLVAADQILLSLRVVD